MTQLAPPLRAEKITTNHVHPNTWALFGADDQCLAVGLTKETAALIVEMSERVGELEYALREAIRTDKIGWIQQSALKPK